MLHTHLISLATAEDILGFPTALVTAKDSFGFLSYPSNDLIVLRTNYDFIASLTEEIDGEIGCLGLGSTYVFECRKLPQKCPLPSCQI
jgi:hypothetical protein